MTRTMVQEKEKERDGERRRGRKEKERDRERDKEQNRDKHRKRDRDRDPISEKRKSRDYGHHHHWAREREEKRRHHDKEKTQPDVISGADAVTFVGKFVREQATSEVPVPSTPSHARPRSTSITDHYTKDPAVDHTKKLKRCCVVSAFPCAASAGLDAGRRMVDFYMSCRGKEKTYPLKGRARRATFLDEEFRRVRDEWMRAGRELKGAIFSGENQKAEPSGMMLDQAPTDPQPPPRLPPMSAQYAREKHDENREGGPTKPPFPRSISDPLPLPSSSPRPLGTRGSKESLPSVMSLPLLGMIRGVPVSHRLPLWVANPGDTMSVSSSNETRNSKLMKSSPLRDGIASAAQDSTNMQPTHIGHAVLGTSILSSSRSGSSRREKSKISRKGTAPQVKDDAKIFVVPLGHKDKDDDATWHGLERRFSSMRSARGTSRHDSPWLGPLTDLNEAIIYTPDYSEFSSDDDWDDDSDSDSDDDAAWPLDGTGVMGYLTPKVAVLSDMPLPYGSYTPLPAMSSSSPYTGAEPYTMPYVSPQVQHSPYQPLSRPRTPLTYGTTPPIQLPRSSPGTVYTPTAHTSHARYSGPYLSESPAAGHATSPYAAASPAAGYTNIAQNYSSPYVQGHGYNN